ncbi:hypothetical protein [Candidatus Entotheonella palauensis]|uniref:Methylamine utilization protein n=1 Tax=Candidatus Entotheonella gemina TaxID=1429439 RepID=W4LYJ8_9BACT|nr:hypothetical protein [Candidatus Entotheonella palauensis]ETX02978.1 MAG: hypothetical protein ETSY2_34415 [Candidatus Entotheonella gemina]
MAVWLGLLVVSLAGIHPAFGGGVTGRVVDHKGNAVEQAVVFVHTAPPDVPLPPTPDVAVMDQVNKNFVPEVLPIAVGTAVSFPNHDQVHHHVYSFSKAKTFEIPLYKGEAGEPIVFNKVGVVKVGCNIHDWMLGIILVVPTPFFTMTDAAGQYTLRDLPPGDYTLASWHRRSRTKVDKTLQQHRIESGTIQADFTLKLRRGRSRPASNSARYD